MTHPLSVVWSSKLDESQAKTSRALLFTVARQCFAISVDFVTKVGEMPPYTAVPGSASWLLGLANHENQPLPLVDVRQFLLKGPPASALSSAIVVECAHGKVLLAVEKIITLVDLAAKPRNALLPDCCTTEYVEYVCEHDDSAVVVVQLASLITAVERAALESTASSGELA